VWKRELPELARPERTVGEHSISVVVPCHDYGRYLGETVASLYAQTRLPDEVLIIDDGSDDETPEVIEKIAATYPDICWMSRRPALGAVRTFNDGVSATSGDLVVILSADDRVSATYLADLAKAFDEASIGFAYPETRLFGACQDVWPARPFDWRVLARANFVNGSAMFRREMYERVGGFDERFARIGKEDWAFYLRSVALGYKGVPVGSCHLEYRQHAEPSRNAASVCMLFVTRWRLYQVAPGVVRLSDFVIGWIGDVRRSVTYWLGARVHRER
jgi:glycosyltransferase involved in cell wall biosynthesis